MTKGMVGPDIPVTKLIPQRPPFVMVDRVLRPAPFVKYVITKSSMDIVNAMKNPDRIPPAIWGSSTLKKESNLL